MLRFIALMLTTLKSCGLVEDPFKDESLGVIASAFGEQRLGVILASSNRALRGARLWCTHGQVEQLAFLYRLRDPCILLTHVIIAAHRDHTTLHRKFALCLWYHCVLGRHRMTQVLLRCLCVRLGTLA
jgi:hypothetical protein